MSNEGEGERNSKTSLVEKPAAAYVVGDSQGVPSAVPAFLAFVYNLNINAEQDVFLPIVDRALATDTWRQSGLPDMCLIYRTYDKRDLIDPGRAAIKAPGIDSSVQEYPSLIRTQT
jgi:hypothetical protein